MNRERAAKRPKRAAANPVATMWTGGKRRVGARSPSP